MPLLTWTAVQRQAHPFGGRKEAQKGSSGGEGDAVQGLMVLADAVVPGGAVPEVVTVFFGLDVLPSGGHLGGGDGEVVFGAQVVAVVGTVDFEYVPLELLVGFQFPVPVAQGQADLTELVVYLEAGEEEGVVVEFLGHGLGDFVVGDAERLEYTR